MLSDYASTMLHRLTDSMVVMEKKLTTMGKRLADARRARKLSRPELAKAMTLTRAAVKQWEDDAVKGIRPENLLRVCEVLGIEPYWLVWGIGPRDASRTMKERTRESRWLAVSRALGTDKGDQLLAYLESRIELEAAGLLPARIEDEP